MNELNVYSLFIDRRLTEEEFQGYLSLVSDWKREKISKYKVIEDAERSLLGEALIRWVLKKHCRELAGKAIILNKNRYGKPFLKGYDDIHFNLSHSEQCVLCGIYTSPIGIDVEKVRERNITFIKRIFTPEEREYVEKSKVEKRMESFYDLWTIKESYVKALGKGLTIPLHSFSVNLNQEEFEIIDSNQREQIKVYPLDIARGCKASVCVINPGDDLKIITAQVGMDDLKEIVEIDMDSWEYYESINRFYHDDANK